jgi:hypothetical protein
VCMYKCICTCIYIYIHTHIYIIRTLQKKILCVCGNRVCMWESCVCGIVCVCGNRVFVEIVCVCGNRVCMWLEQITLEKEMEEIRTHTYIYTYTNAIYDGTLFTMCIKHYSLYIHTYIYT